MERVRRFAGAALVAAGLMAAAPGVRPAVAGDQAVASIAPPWSSAAPASAMATYRLRVTLRVGGQTVSGEAVQAVTVATGTDDFTDDAPPPVRVAVAGEAVVIPVPGQPTLIVPMFWGNEDLFGLYVTTGCGLGGRTVDAAQLIAAIGRFRGACSIEPGHALPVLSIADPADPMTIATAGDAEIESIEVTATDAPVSTGITARFPWLSSPGADTATVYRDPTGHAKFHKESFVR
jgi:hypothetical protein